MNKRFITGFFTFYQINHRFHGIFCKQFLSSQECIFCFFDDLEQLLIVNKYYFYKKSIIWIISIFGEFQAFQMSN